MLYPLRWPTTNLLLTTTLMACSTILTLSSSFGLTWILIAQPHAVRWRLYLRNNVHCQSVPLAAVMKQTGGFYQGERAVRNRRLSFASQGSTQQSLRN